MAKSTYRDLVDRTGPAITRGYWASRLKGTAALLFDVLGTAATNAARAALIRDTMGPAYDALDPLGQEQRQRRYTAETWVQHRARLQSIWERAPLLGTFTNLLSELTAAGLPGAEIKTASDWPLEPPVDHWSQFWVNYPVGTHTVTSAGYPIGSFTIGAVTIGAEGIALPSIRTLRQIVRDNKPGHWVCRGIRFQLGGSDYAQISV